jgi:hypothetical protein
MGAQRVEVRRDACNPRPMTSLLSSTIEILDETAPDQANVPDRRSIAPG